MAVAADEAQALVDQGYARRVAHDAAHGDPGGRVGPATRLRHGGMSVQAGQVLDVPAGSALETAIGTSNLTALSGTPLVNDLGGLIRRPADERSGPKDFPGSCSRAP